MSYVRCAQHVLGLVAVVLTAQAFATEQPVDWFSPAVTAEIQALLLEKDSRTPAQRKLSSQLIYARKEIRGEPVAQGVRTLTAHVDCDPANRVLVDVSARVTDALLDRIGDVRGEVVNAFPRYQAIRAWLPFERLEEIAELPDVRTIRPADVAFSQKVNTSRGDVAHRADLARSSFGIAGNGVKIGVISDSVDHLASVQATGDVGPVTVLAGQSGVPGSGEGTAMLEIVHDLAPSAALLFASGFGSQASMAANIEGLREAGCDIIVDDVGYLAEPVFQDGVIAQAVNTATTAGTLYFSAAGNCGSQDHGTSGVWEGDFADSGMQMNGLPINDFGGGATANSLTDDPPLGIVLQWADPLGSSANDYDLFLIDPVLGSTIAASTDTQSGAGDPIEFISSDARNDTGNRLVIVKNSGAARFLHLDALGGRMSNTTAGATHGHSAAVDAFSVAAVSTANTFGPFIGGPANPIEPFSSDGPRRIFFQSDGSPITPGNFSSSGGEVRQKPDVAAADNVATDTPGFNPFVGTSAAAPHAAAIAALARSANPSLSTAELRSALVSTTLDIEAAGIDRDAGAGILDALNAVLAAVSSPATPNGATPTPTATAVFTSTATATPTPSATESLSPTPTNTPTPTFSYTVTTTPTATSTPSFTQTLTSTPTDTPTPTLTYTFTATTTATSTPSFTETLTPTSTDTPTPTSTYTFTATTTATSTPSFTETLTPTPTDTPTPTSTYTFTATTTATSTPSFTQTLTPTLTDTPTPTFSYTITTTPTATSTPSFTQALTPTPTDTPTPTFSHTFAATPTQTVTNLRPGDVNCDGVVSAADVSAVESGEAGSCRGDVDGSGVLDGAALKAVIAAIFGDAAMTLPASARPPWSSDRRPDAGQRW